MKELNLEGLIGTMIKDPFHNEGKEGQFLGAGTLAGQKAVVTASKNGFTITKLRPTENSENKSK